MFGVLGYKERHMRVTGCFRLSGGLFVIYAKQTINLPETLQNTIPLYFTSNKYDKKAVFQT